MTKNITESQGSTDDSAQRQCARCRRHFPVAEGTDPIELIGWWTCSPCTESLLPGRPRSTDADRQESAT